MSLYNTLFGVNNLAPILLKMLCIDQPIPNAPEFPEDWNPYDDGVTPEGEQYIKDCKEKKFYTSGRFRDIYLNEDGSRIILYTRNGGGNRESYPHIFSILQSHPNFITDYDDDFDCTYCNYEFSVPDEYKEDCKNIAINNPAGTSPSDRFQQLIKDLESGVKSETTDNAMKVGEKIMGQVKDALDSGENKIIEI